MFVWRERQRNLERCSRETKRVKVIQIDLHTKKERVNQIWIVRERFKEKRKTARQK